MGIIRYHSDFKTGLEDKKLIDVAIKILKECLSNVLSLLKTRTEHSKLSALAAIQPAINFFETSRPKDVVNQSRFQNLAQYLKTLRDNIRQGENIHNIYLKIVNSAQELKQKKQTLDDSGSIKVSPPDIQSELECYKKIRLHLAKILMLLDKNRANKQNVSTLIEQIIALEPAPAIAAKLQKMQKIIVQSGHNFMRTVLLNLQILAKSAWGLANAKVKSLK